MSTPATTPSPREAALAAEAGRTVRDATFDTLRSLGLTTVYSNPGSTEIAFLTGFPDDLDFVLGLHEGAVVAMAAGDAIGAGEPRFVLLHTTAGLGNAVSALATARSSRAPLVVAVGQQDRRHLALEPFLAGRLEGLAGDYPVSVETPVRPQDVPGALRRAHGVGGDRPRPRARRRPAGRLVRAGARAARDRRPGAPRHLARGRRRGGRRARRLPGQRERAGARGRRRRSDRRRLGRGHRAGRAPARSGSSRRRSARAPASRRVHPLFAGHLPADRPRLRETLRPFAPSSPSARPSSASTRSPRARSRRATRAWRWCPTTRPRCAAARSTSRCSAIRGATAAALAARLDQRAGDLPPAPAPLPEPAPPAPGAPLLAVHVLAGLAARLPEDAIVVEETPSSRHQLTARLPARTPLGYVSAAMGGLGFAIPGAAGLRRALPGRPVVAIVGDGSMMFQIQALWAAARYDAGALFVVLVNDGYKVMDKLAERFGAAGPWPGFGGIDHAAIARAQGCEAVEVSDFDALQATLDEVVPTLRDRTTPAAARRPDRAGRRLQSLGPRDCSRRRRRPGGPGGPPRPTRRCARGSSPRPAARRPCRRRRRRCGRA